MLLLIADIAYCFGNLRLADREGSITSLPIEFLAAVLFHPYRAVTFDVADQFGKVIAAQRNKKMRMICRAVRYDKFLLVAFSDRFFDSPTFPRVPLRSTPGFNVSRRWRQPHLISLPSASSAYLQSSGMLQDSQQEAGGTRNRRCKYICLCRSRRRPCRRY
jgi:hypothetical protein